jgi:hypothetical protein
MNLRFLAVACWAALVATGARGAEIPLGQPFNWTATEDGGTASFHGGGLSLTFKGAGEADGNSYTITVQQGHGRSFVLKQDGLDHDVSSASFVIEKADAAASGNQIVVESHLGGPKCCNVTTIIEHTRHGWKAVELPGGWESGAAGSQINDVLSPKDVDGDGSPDFIVSDDRFEYEFVNYVEAWLPPRIFSIRDGRLLEESSSRKFVAVFLKDMEEAKPGCLHHNGFQDGQCAGYVADAARVGRFEAAWRLMLANYAKDDVLDTCKIRLPKVNCPKRAMTPSHFPFRLAHFLKNHGYIAARQFSWAMSERRR